MNLDNQIKQLLFQHDCIIVPDFGGFVCQNTPATLQAFAHRMEPPKKSISFNKSLVKNDALLVSAVQESEQVNYTEALSLVREAVNQWKSTLNQAKRLQINGVGTIFIDSSEKWRFTQDEGLNFNLSAFGLGSIKLMPQLIELSTSETSVIPIAPIAPETVEMDNVIPISKPQKKSRKVIYALAAACLLPVAFYSYWLPSNTNALDRGYVKASDFNPFNTSHNLSRETIYVVRNSAQLNTFSTPSPESPLSNTFDFEGRSFKISDKKTLKPANTTHKINTGNFHLIGGCFREKSNADKQIEDLKSAGFKSYLLDIKAGLHRVCVGSYATSSEAKSAKDALIPLGKSGWILKR